jgi:hypothetical protein
MNGPRKSDSPKASPGSFATIGCAARLARVPVTTIDELIRAGRIRTDRINGKLHVCVEDVERECGVEASS